MNRGNPTKQAGNTYFGLKVATYSLYYFIEWFHLAIQFYVIWCLYQPSQQGMMFSDLDRAVLCSLDITLFVFSLCFSFMSFSLLLNFKGNILAIFLSVVINLFLPLRAISYGFLMNEYDGAFIILLSFSAIHTCIMYFAGATYVSNGWFKKRG